MKYNDEYDEVHKFYSLDDEYLDTVADDLSSMFSSFAKAWKEISREEVLHILRVGLQVYYFRTHSHILAAYGRARPKPVELSEFARRLKVPRFVRDMYREMCRPMKSNSTVYLPDISFTAPGLEQPLFRLFGEIPKFARWDYACKECEFEMVEIQPESPSPCPLSFFNEDLCSVIAVSGLEDWRIEAFGILRHLKHLGDVLPESIRVDYEKTVIVEPFMKPLIGRSVGNDECFLYNVMSKRRRVGVYRPEYRFPALEEHSETPPKSERAESGRKPSETVRRVRTKRGVLEKSELE